MKKWIIIKLTSLFFALILLVGVMFGSLMDENNDVSSNYTGSGDIEFYDISYTYNDDYFNASPDEPYSVGNATIDCKDVKTIFIDWVNGNIDILETDDMAISITEEDIYDSDSLKLRYYNSDSLKLRYRVINDTLEVRYADLNVSPIEFHNSKKLTLNLPVREKDNFKIKTNATKSDILIRDVTLDELSSTSTSGNLTINNGKVYNLYYSANIGNVYTNCSSNNINVKLDSGLIDCTLDNSTKNVSLNLNEGKINVRIPENISGYLARLHFSELSGRFGHHSDFENETEESYDGEYILRYGDESLFINASMSNGDFDIFKI